MPEFQRGAKLPTRPVDTLKSGNRGFLGFLRGKAVPKQPPVGDALGQLNDPRSSTGGGVPPQPPFSTGQWMKLQADKVAGGAYTIYDAISKIRFFGGQRTANIDLAPPPYETATELEYPGREEHPPHDQTVVSAARVIQYLLARFNPLRGLTPRRLEQDMEQWQLGFLRWLSLDWSFIRERDDQIMAVETKRIFAVSRLKWEIMATDESPEATAHKEALEAFYNNLTTTHVIDQNEQGGVGLLIRQMMQAIGSKWAVHEMIWRPDVDPETGKPTLTANFRFVPLWFFENRTGQIRYLPYELALDGIPLDAGGWLITCGDGLLMASSIAYMYKQLALRSWVAFCEKFAIPYLHGKTPASYNSQEWNQMLSTLQNFASDGAMVTNDQAKVEMIAPPASAVNPQEMLTDRMDRAIARLWRGADLSTMSRAGSGTGALPQIQNEDELAEADGIKVSEALNFYVDRYVVGYLLGAKKCLAYFRSIPPLNIDTAKQIAVDQFLIGAGVPLGRKDAYARYGLREPDAGEELLQAPAIPAQIGKGVGDAGVSGALSLGNSALGQVFRAAAMRELSAAQAKALLPIAERVRSLSEIDDDAKRLEAAESIKKDLPSIFKSISARSGEVVSALSDIIGTAALSGATQAAAKQGSSV